MLQFDEGSKEFHLNYFNYDGEVIDRYAAQHYAYPRDLISYLRSDTRLAVQFKGKYPAKGISDDLLHEGNDSNPELLSKVIRLYNQFFNAKPGIWAALRESEHTTDRQRLMMEVCELSYEKKYVKKLWKTTGHKSELESLRDEIINEETLLSPEFIKIVREHFPQGRHSSSDIKKNLQRIYEQHGLNIKAKAPQIVRYCNVKEGKSQRFWIAGKTVAGYEII